MDAGVGSDTSATSVPEAIEQFGLTSDAEAQREDYLKEHDKSLSQLEVEDLSWIIDRRPSILKYFQWLLGLQNVAVFGLVIYGIVADKAADLRLVFSILVGATLTGRQSQSGTSSSFSSRG